VKVRIIIGADHAGFLLKEAVTRRLADRSTEVIDVGTWSDEPVDYPDFGALVAGRVSSGEFEKGILICGSGVGMSMVANKFPGVRAALAFDTNTAVMSRRHNDSNILVLAARRTDEATADAIVDAWMTSEFDGGRHSRRLKKIESIEKKINSV
jgi:ribose 5-phosphate isomerase B